MHLAKWSSLANPKALGGWGIKYIHLFARSLAGRNLWWLSIGNSLWIKVMWSKYFPNLYVIKWFRKPNNSSKGSIVWKALVEAFPLVGDCVVWKIGDRKKFRVGEYPWLGT
jgi:hypothetical protein